MRIADAKNVRIVLFCLSVRFFIKKAKGINERSDGGGEFVFEEVFGVKEFICQVDVC